MAPETIEALAREVGGIVSGNGDLTVSDATHDSRQVDEESLYVAMVGARYDGHDFVDQAVAAGAPAVCVSKPVETTATRLMVADTRRALGPLAAAVHGWPSNDVSVVGVTGTNGKTTVTHFVESILTATGRSAGLIGTIATRLGDRHFATTRTTPEATDFQRLLATMRDSGADAVAAEVSSHALELGRVSGTRFAVAAFTNLTQDHLDFHGHMEAYGAAKRRLFTDYTVENAVINIDDEFGRSLADEVSVPLTKVGADGDFLVVEMRTTAGGSEFTLVERGRHHRLATKVIGSFNVQNVAIAVGCGDALGLEMDEMLDAVPRLAGVPGRFELVSEGRDPRVIVDYAHTPASVASAVSAGQQFSEGRVIVVVGAGGDRDAEKRVGMGSAAASADLVVVTSDNPRTEDPAEIAASVAEGVPEERRLVELDRRKAIEHAISVAGEADVILILGKGHETGQEIGGNIYPFDDRDVARDVLGRAGSDPSPAGEQGAAG